MSREDYRSLAPHLKHVTLSLDKVLVERNKANNYVYFPLAGLISVHTIFADRVSFDMVGKDGMVGVFVAAGVDTPRALISIQGSGSAAMRVPSRQFRALAKRSGTLQRQMHRYTCLLLKRLAQTSRCNGLHTVEARLARWLLETSDRAGTQELRVTHEHLANAMAARRANVTVAANALRSLNLIAYTRARLRIVDRKGLVKAACACYRSAA